MKKKTKPKPKPRTRALSVLCGACQERCLVDVPAASVRTPEQRADARYDCFYVCADCTPAVELAEDGRGQAQGQEETQGGEAQGGGALVYFLSHLAESVVNFSSDE